MLGKTNTINQRRKKPSTYQLNDKSYLFYPQNKFLTLKVYITNDIKSKNK